MRHGVYVTQRDGRGSRTGGFPALTVIYNASARYNNNICSVRTFLRRTWEDGNTANILRGLREASVVAHGSRASFNIYIELHCETLTPIGQPTRAGPRSLKASWVVAGQGDNGLWVIRAPGKGRAVIGWSHKHVGAVNRWCNSLIVGPPVSFA